MIATTTLAGVRETLAAYRTCEFATVGRSGVPVAWPTVFMVSPDGDRITITTSIGLPRKAFNIRRDPRVALLFSDPTGTGRTDLPQVLVQGTASCPEEIHTGPDGLEAYWQQLWERQPDSGIYHTAVGRRVMDFYYLRLVIDVTPEVVSVRPPLVRDAPVHAVRPARRDHRPYAEAARRLPSYHDAVLAYAGPSGPIALHRVGVATDPAAGRLVLHEPGGAELVVPDGPASLLVHRHDEQIGDLHQFVLLGQVESGTFLPTTWVQGVDGTGPLTVIRMLRTMRQTSRRYLERRGLPWPAVDWEAYARLR